MEVMYHTLKDNVAFRKYDSMMEFLARKAVVLDVSKKPGNANLRSERIKTEIIHTLGRGNKVYSLKTKGPNHSI